MIKTIKDFENKYIKLPQNISRRKFNKIKKKFKRLGVNVRYMNYDDISYGLKYIYKACSFAVKPYTNKIGLWNEGVLSWEGGKEISIKEFLKNEPNKRYISVDIECLGITMNYCLNEEKTKFKKGDKVTTCVNKRTGDRSWTDEVLIYIGEYRDSYIVKRTKGCFIESPIYLCKEDYDLFDAKDLIKLLKENFKEE